MTKRFSSLFRTVKMVGLIGSLVSLIGCRDPDDLVASISATVIVVGIQSDELVQLDLEGLRLRAQTEAGDNLVSFGVSLPVGTFQGQVTIFEVEADDDGPVLRPRDCGPFTVTVAGSGDPVAIAIVAADLPDCEGEDVDDTVETVETVPVDDPVDDASEGEGEGEGEDPEP